MKKKLLLGLLCILQSFLFVLQAQNTQRNIAYTDDNVRFTVISDERSAWNMLRMGNL